MMVTCELGWSGAHVSVGWGVGWECGDSVKKRLSGESGSVTRPYDSCMYVCMYLVCVCVKSEKGPVHLLKLLAVDPTCPSQT